MLFVKILPQEGDVCEDGDGGILLAALFSVFFVISYKMLYNKK